MLISDIQLKSATQSSASFVGSSGQAQQKLIVPRDAFGMALLLTKKLLPLNHQLRLRWLQTQIPSSSQKPILLNFSIRFSTLSSGVIFFSSAITGMR